MTPRWEKKVEYAATTDVGLRRTNNQDSWAAILASDGQTWRQRGHLFIVADGMGAHAVGELASKLAVDMIPLNYEKRAHLQPPEALRQAVCEANTAVYARGHQNREFEGMGTTATVLVLRPEGATVAHVGDSRVYRVRDGLIEQLSFDHSLAWEAMRRRGLRRDLASQLPTNVILRSLGPEPQLEVDIEGPFPVRPGDVYLLCSDGLSGQVSDEEIGVLAAHLPPSEVCQMLVHLANLRGGPDNITVLAARILDGEHADEPEPAEASSRSGLGQRLQALVAAMFSRWRSPHGGAERHAGRAPYRSVPCQLSREHVVQLMAMEQQLRQTAIDETWNIDWSAFYRHHNQVEELARTGEWNRAFEQGARAVSFLMMGLRRQRKLAMEGHGSILNRDS